MSDQDFGKRLAGHLSEAAEQLSAAQKEKLGMARLRALERARMRAPQPVGALAGVGVGLGRQLRDSHKLWRVGLIALAIGAAIAFSLQFNDVQTDDDIDTLLLSDELPPDAYISERFDTILQGHSQS
ncbi:DUF3619 family protein [Parachitinimonas caeni]|uniref:DUF3619 family protein n=1 Tax=Parachitinimonas caeni TaxID=3031301 RepID=A0ABT7E1Y1_9NEIS|nr:DUF3619 family protein [Parachitinimonas caeni]MDK2126322.1 DUF3619 family protein [Parachitinimonas caeni]